uniref:Uncharacterized protein n=1 Tax=Oryza sativa subsp. japonica TaxID=39947 RepID=Q60EG8_ORYSJ|nr:hypothetical protein [Oryza sativa Japonica Group]AAV59345.1 hypothetical protein [Oryza sativa Japonica Group]
MPLPRLLPSAKLPKTTAASIGYSGRLLPLARPLFQLDPPSGLGEVATNELRHRLDHLSGQIRHVGLRRLLSPRGLKEAATAVWAQGAPRLPPLRGLGVAKGRDRKGKRIREREEDVRPAAAPPSAVNARATLLATAT